MRETRKYGEGGNNKKDFETQMEASWLKGWQDDFGSVGDLKCRKACLTDWNKYNVKEASDLEEHKL